MRGVTEAAQEVDLAFVCSRQLTAVADTRHLCSAGFSWTGRDGFTGNMGDVFRLFRIRDVDNGGSVVFLLSGQRVHLRPTMMTDVSEPPSALLMDGWLIRTPSLEVVIAHQIHVVLLRLLLCGFHNRQRHKNCNQKASFHGNGSSVSVFGTFCAHHTPNRFRFIHRLKYIALEILRR